METALVGGGIDFQVTGYITDDTFHTGFGALAIVVVSGSFVFNIDTARVNLNEIELEFLIGKEVFRSVELEVTGVDTSSENEVAVLFEHDFFLQRNDIHLL